MTASTLQQRVLFRNLAKALFGVLTSFLIVLSPLGLALVQAAINPEIAFQGRVINANGSNVSSGVFPFVFAIYSQPTGGTALWTENKTLTVTNSVFATNLGSATPFPGSINFNSDALYLGISFNGDGEMTPRVRLTGVAQSFNSNTVNGLSVTATTGSLTVPNNTNINFGAAVSTGGTLTTGGDLTTVGSNPLTLRTTGSTDLTLPTTGTIATQAGAETLSNKTLGATTLAGNLTPSGSVDIGSSSSQINAVHTTNLSAANGLAISGGTGAVSVSGGLNNTNGGITNTGAISGATSVTASGAVQGSSLTDGTATLTVGALSGVTGVATSGGYVQTGGTANTFSGVTSFVGNGTALSVTHDASVGGNLAVTGTINSATISGGTLSGTAVNGVTTANILVNTGSYSDPSWITALAATKITGQFTPASGGTGLDTSTATGVPLITSGTWSVANGVNNQCLIIASGVPQWGNCQAGGGATITGSPVAGQIAYWSGAGTITGSNYLTYDATNGTVGINTTRSGAISGTNALAVIKGSGATSSTSTFDVQSSGGASRFFVRDDGKVGIGTNTPGATLDINGTATIASTLTVTAGGASVSGGLNNNNGGITNAGSIAGATDIGTSGGYTQTGTSANTFSGATSFTAAGTALSVTNNASVGGTLAVTSTINGATISGGSLSATAVNGVTTANILLSTGSYANPAWLTGIQGSIVSGDITGNAGNVTGTVAVGHGGTGLTSVTTNAILYGNGAGNLQVTNVGTSGQVVVASATGVPTFTSVSGDATLSNLGVLTLADGSVTSAKILDGTITASDLAAGDFSTKITSGTYSINISGNATTVSNGVYTTGSYNDPAWITGLAGSKISGSINNVAIGNVTPASGAFTTLSVSGDVTVGANASLKLTGGTSFPGSPTEGQLFFRTDTKQLYIYENSQWQADRSTATEVVAASNSSNKEKADYVGDGSNDQNAINAAINALPAGGGLVYLLDGTYNIAAGISFTKSNVALTGAGASSVLKRMFDNGALLTVGDGGTTTVSGVSITNLSFDGNNGPSYASTNNSLVYLNQKVSNTRLNNNWLANSSGPGIVLAGGGASATNNYIQVNGNTVTSVGTYGISLGDWLNYATVANNVVNTVSGVGSGIDAATGGHNYHLTIANNTLTSTSRFGISVLGYYHTITGNTVNGATYYGISSSMFYGSITGNALRGNGQAGIILNGASGNNTVSGNTLFSNGTAGAYSSINVASSSNNVISDNNITGNGGSGYAILIAAGSNSNYLAGNRYSGTGATQISDLGTGTTYGSQLAGASGTDLELQTAGNILLNGLTVSSSANITNAGTYNGQTLSSAAVLTGTLSVATSITSPVVNVGTTGVATGVVALSGVNSGTISIQAQATAGTYNFNLPTTAGTSGYLLSSAGGGSNAMTWTNPASIAAGSVAFSGITAGTNTAAAMLVGTGASLDVTGSGTINATTLLSGTWAAPGAIGSGTPNSGSFTSLTVAGTANINVTGTANTSIGNSTGTFALASNALTVTTGGALSGISTITTSSTINSQTISAAASFTGTLSVATSLTTPIVYGGSGASSTLSLNGTSNGSPSNAYVLLNSAGQGNVGIGTATPTGALNIVKTTEQLRVGYDASNYASFTVGSTGSLTIAPNGTNSAIALNPKGTGALTVASGVTSGTTTSSALALSANSLTSGTGLYIASSSLSSGKAVDIQVSGTAAASNTQTALNVATTGANATGSQTTYGAQIANTHTGSGTNVGLQVSASGGGNNYALLVSSGSVGIGTTAPTAALTIKGTTATDAPTISAELLSSSGWTSTNWTGDFTTGWTHTTGNTTVLSRSTAVTSGHTYLINYVVNGTAGSFTMALGGQSIPDTDLSSSTQEFTATATTGLTVTPSSDFNGTIGFSLKEVSGTASPLLVLKASDNTTALEVRTGAGSQSGFSLNNIFIGADSGRYTVSDYWNNVGIENTALGASALSYNTTGAFNTALGDGALFYNTVGSNNLALGQAALFNNVSGNANTATGMGSLSGLTTGSANSALGSSAGASIADGSTANTTSNNSLYLGADTKALADGDTNESVIGYNATGHGSNTVTIGNTSVTNTYINGALAVTGAITAAGVNAGVGLLQGTGGLTVTGAVNINTTGTGTTAIGNATGTFQLASSGLSVSTGGALTGVSSIANSGAYTQSGSSTNTFTGATTFSAAGTALSVNNNVTIGGTLTVPTVQTASGNLSLQAYSGVVALNTTGTQNELRVYASDGSSYADLTHNGTNTVLSSSNGEVQIQGTGANNFVLGDTGVAVNLVFQNSSTISGLGTNTITLGQSGDTFGLNTTGVTYNVNTLTAPTGALISSSSTTATALTVNAPTSMSGNLVDLQVNGTSQFSVSSTGVVTSAGGLAYTGLTQGSVLFTGSGGTVSQNNANFFWDNTNTRLGIGTLSPATALNVQATAEQLRLAYDATHYASYTVDASGNLTVAPSGGTANITGALAVTGALTAAGVNSGVGLLQGTGGLTITGTTAINTTGTANTSIGNATGTFALASSALNVSTAGAISGVSTITTSGAVGIGTGVPGSAILAVQGTAATDLPTYGSEFLSASGWTTPAGWSGSWAGGFVHANGGGANALTQSTAASIGTKYQITYTVSNRNNGSFTISFGGQTKVGSGITATGSYGPTATTTAGLSITPTTDFDGTIILSIKPITAVSSPLLVLNSSDSATHVEIRAGTGAADTFVGTNSGANNTTGSSNSALGNATLQFTTTGGSNTAMGNAALREDTTGFSNTGVGVNALRYTTYGYGNTALGVDAGDFITGGSTQNTISNYSLYLGYQTYAQADGDSNEIVMGYNTTGHGSNTVTIGNSSVTANYLTGTLATTGAITAAGLNAGAGLIQGTGGLTVTGTAAINTTGTANTSIGNSTGTFALTSNGGLNVSTAGALTGVSSIANSGAYTQTGSSANTFSGDSSFTGAGTGLAVTNNATIGGTLTVTGATTVNNTLSVTTSTTGTLAIFNQTGTGSILDLQANGSSVLTVADTGVTVNRPLNLTSAGDFVLGYDLVMTNGTASYIKSDAPLYIQAGDASGNYDLNLSASGSGSIYANNDFQATSTATIAGAATLSSTLAVAGIATFNSAVTTGATTSSGVVLNANALTSGTGLYVASSSLTSGKLVDLQVSGTAAVSNTQTTLNILTAGANATDAQTTYGLQVSNTHTTSASTNTNVAGYFSATGGTTNYGLIVASGNVGIGTTTPGQALDVGSGNIATLGKVGIGVTPSSNYILSIQSSTAYGARLVTSSAATVAANNGNFDLRNTDATANNYSSINFWNSNGSAGGYTSGIEGISVNQNATASASGSIRFVTNNAGTIAERVRIQYDGKVGIGVSSPNAQLHVLSTTEQLRLAYDASNYASFLTSASGNLTVTPSGGATTVTGTLTVTSATTLSATGANALALTGAPTNSATSSLVQIGGAIASGNTAANGGTYIGLNAPGSGAGSAADLVNLQGNGTSLFKIDKTGAITTVAGVTSTIDSISFSGFGVIYNSGTLNLGGGSSTSVNLSPAASTNGSTEVYGAQLASNTFNPTSGTGIYDFNQITPTVNQTGGANGITRGLYIKPTLTAAADWRSIEITNNTGYAIYSTGTAASSLGGALTVTGLLSANGDLHVTSANATGTTTSASLSVAANSLTTGTGLYVASSTLTSGKGVDIQVSGTAAATGQTALNIATAGASASSSVTSYGAQVANTHTGSGTNVGLQVSASGGSNNYALLVSSGSVGIGTSSPNVQLEVLGTADALRVSYDATHYTALSTDSSGYGTIASTGAYLFFNATHPVVDNNLSYMAKNTTGTSVSVLKYDGSNQTVVGANGEIAMAGYITLQPSTTNSVTVNSSVTTGATTSSALVLNANSLTSGTGLYVASSSLSSGKLVDLQVSGTAANSNTQTALNIATAGANTNSTQTTYGAQIANTHSGTSSTNIGLQVSASGGSNNYALLVSSGQVGIGTASPTEALTVTNGNLYVSNDTTLGSDIETNGTSESAVMTIGATNVDVNETFAQSSAQAHGGTYSSSMTVTADGTAYRDMGTVTEFKPGQRYTASVYIYNPVANTGTANVGIYAVSSTSNIIGPSSINTATKGSWTLLTSTFTIPSNAVNATHLRFVTNSSSKAGDVVYFDDLTVQPVTGGNIMTAGLFTGGGTAGLKVDTTGNVGIGTATPAYKLAVQGAASNDAATLGAELTAAGNSFAATNWTGSYAAGFTHTAGNTSALVDNTPTITAGQYYQLSFTISSQSAGTVTPSVGGTADNAVSNNQTYTLGIKATGTGKLTFTPTSDFNGKIGSLSLKQVTATAAPQLAVLDSTGATSLTVQSTTASLQNIYIGLLSGQYNTTGSNNVGLGYSALSSNTTGYNNIAIGYQALTANTTGYGNLGIGYQALGSNVSGTANIALGNGALYTNTTGGANVAFGYNALYANSSGVGNTATGYYSLFSNTTGSNNTSYGSSAAQNNQGGGANTSVGASALYGTTSGSNNTAFGYFSLLGNQTGGNNVAIGAQAGQGTQGSSNINYNTILGYQAGLAVLTGADSNTLIGYQAGNNITTGASNILIGAGTTTTTASTSNQLNIGNLVYGDLSVKTASLATGVTTGTTTSAGLAITANSATTGTGLYIASSSLTSGKAVDIQVSGTAAATGQTALNIATAGANGTSGQTTYGAQIANTHTGSGTNVGLQVSASGGSANYALLVSSGNVGIDTTTPNYKLSIQGSSTNDSAGLGAETLSNGGWTSTNWTGSWSTGWIHTSGHIDYLTSPTATTAATRYQVSWTVSGASTGTYKVYIGGITSNTYTFTNGSYAWGPTTTNTDPVQIQPSSGFDGTIAISVKQIVSVAIPVMAFSSSDTTVRVEARADATLAMTAYGFEAGAYNTTGQYNTSFGYGALKYTTTGSRNIGIGYQALGVNTWGDGNVAIGYEALQNSVYAGSNTAVGYTALNADTTGQANTALGYGALTSITTGSNSIAVGQGAGQFIADGTTVNATSGTSTYLGTATKASADGDTNEIVIGYNATGNGTNTATLGNTSIATTVLQGNVGLGVTSSLGAKLHVLAAAEQLRLGYDSTHYTSFITNSSGNLNIAPSGGTASLSVTTAGSTDNSPILKFEGNNYTNPTNTVGSISLQYRPLTSTTAKLYFTNAGIGTSQDIASLGQDGTWTAKNSNTTGTPDYAEYIQATSDVETGDVVMPTTGGTGKETFQATKNTVRGNPSVLGAISDGTSGFTIDAYGQFTDSLGQTATLHGKPMTLAGRIPVKVTTKNGSQPIHQGDLLMASDKAGYAEKYDPNAAPLVGIIGEALTDLLGGDGLVTTQVQISRVVSPTASLATNVQDLTVQNLTVKNLTATGNTTLQNLSVVTDTLLQGALNVGKDATFQGSVTVGTDGNTNLALVVNGTARFGSNQNNVSIDANGTLTRNGTAHTNQGVDQFGAVQAASTTAVQALQACPATTTTETTGFTNPDVPRTLSLTLNHHTSKTDLKATVTGVLADGSQGSEDITLNDNGTVTGVKAFATITSIVVPACGSGVSLSVGTTDVLGLANSLHGQNTVYKIKKNTSDVQPIPAVDATNSTVDLGPLTNGDQVTIWYKY